MNIYEAITAIMQESYSISKDKFNKTQGFKYRGIDDVMNTFYPLLAKHHVFVVPEVLSQEREERQSAKGGTLLYSMLTIRYTFYAEDGSSVAAVVVGEGMDSGDKASNKAMAVGMKYALFQTFCIPTEEMPDPDSESHDVKPAPKKEAKVPDSEKVAPLYICEECYKPLKEYEHNGKKVSIEDHVSRSKEKFKKVLCIDCIKQKANEKSE